jgi:hypothetical protein
MASSGFFWQMTGRRRREQEFPHNFSQLALSEKQAPSGVRVHATFLQRDRREETELLHCDLKRGDTYE